MTTKYHILVCETPAQLITAVQIHVDDGWELVGSATVSSYIDRGQLCETWAQTIIRRLSAHAVQTESGR